MSVPTLSLPKKKPTAWVAETSPKATRLWLDRLPMSDHAEVARELYRALYTLNRLEINPPKRFQILELYRIPVNTVAATLQSQLSREPLPLSARLMQISEFLRELHREMATGYKLVLMDYHLSWRRRLRLKSQAVPIERALRYMGELLLHCYNAYLPYPANIWREINEIYRYAESMELAELPVDIDIHRDAGSTSVAERYKQINLLGLCDPYHLPQGEAKKIHSFLYAWADKAHIMNVEAMRPDTNRFYIDLLQDRPPRVYQQEIDPSLSKRIRIIDSADLVTQVDHFIRRLERGEPAAHMGLGIDCLESACLELLSRLSQSWSIVPARKHTRSSGKGRITMCIGIEAVRFFASGQHVFTLPQDLIVPAEMPSSSADSVDIDFGADLPYPETTNTAQPGDTESRQENFHLSHWGIIDQSASGLLLRGNPIPGVLIRVGDFLGVQFADAVDWWPAVVRRMQGDISGRIKIGIMLLASGIRPAAVSANSNPTDFQAALYLPELETPTSRQPASLVVPRSLLREQTDFYLYLGAESGVRRVRSLKTVEQTGSFEQIHFADVLPVSK